MMSSTDLSQGSTNYLRLCCLLLQEGTKCAQETVLAHLPERKAFRQVLEEKKLHFKKMKAITRVQFDTLYNSSGDISCIDISLWVTLARNITTKNSRRGIDFNKSPQKDDTHWAHDLIRLREIRNCLFHVNEPELVGEKFNELRGELIRVLRRLGTSDSVIEEHMNRDLDPEQTRIYRLQLREQYMEDHDAMRRQAAEHKRHTCISTIAVSVLSVLVLTTVAIVIGWYYEQKPPCSRGIQQSITSGGVLYYMSRAAWGAKPFKNPETLEILKTPVKMAVVFHTALVIGQCTVTDDCCDVVRSIQEFSQSKNHWSDIPYNYLIGADGVVYEGRGPKYAGAAAYGRNREIISIAVIGHFVCQRPSPAAMVALYVLLQQITERDPSGQTNHSLITNNYRLYGHCQINISKHSFPDSPGEGIMREIQYWKHLDHTNISRCNIDNDCLKSAWCCMDSCQNLSRINE